MMDKTQRKMAVSFINRLTLIANHLWWLALMVKITLAGLVLSALHLAVDRGGAP